MSEETGITVRPATEGDWPERVAWLAWPLFAVVLALAVAGLVFAYLSRGFHPPSNWGTGTILGILALTVPFVCSAAVGAFLASRMPRNLIGWLLILVGFGFAATAAGDGYGFYGVVVREPDLPGAVVASWLELWGWIFSIGIPLGFIPMLFPEGRVTRRTAPFLAVALLTLALTVVGSMLQVYPLSSLDRPNPFGLERFKTLMDVLAELFFVFIPLGVIGVVRLARRMRRSSGDERQQIKWFLLGVAIPVIGISAAGLSTGIAAPSDQALSPFWAKVTQDVGTFMFIAVPIATGVAVLKYRLYDIDLV
ncbi:MAG: hypothetical protein ACRDHO_04060, partial [Actinomycetota bacterium]